MGTPAIVLGCRHGPFESDLSEEFVRRFAAATSDDNPAYLDAQAVPPTAIVTRIFEAQAVGNSDVPQEVWDSMQGGVHGEHEVILHRPLEPGEKLTTWVEGWGGGAVGKHTRVTIRFETRDAADQVVAEQWWTTMLLGTHFAETVGLPPPDHTFPEVAKSRPVTEVRLFVDEDMVRRYAEVSGDWSDHHFEVEAAARAGMTEPFLHGLCTFGLCARAAVDHLAGGDPRRIHRLAVRFASPLLLKRDLEVSLFDIGGGAFAFEACCEGQPIVRHGRVELF